MKLLILFFFFIASCSDSIKSPVNKEPKPNECPANYVIFESLADQNKPIPVLAFYDSLATPKKFEYAKDFALNRKVLCEIKKCATGLSDTFGVKKPLPLYLVTIVSDTETIERYVNTENQLKDLFDCLERVLKEHSLYQPFKAVYDIRGRLMIP